MRTRSYPEMLYEAYDVDTLFQHKFSSQKLVTTILRMHYISCKLNITSSPRNRVFLNSFGNKTILLIVFLLKNICYRFHTNGPDCNLKLQQAGTESMSAICDDPA